MAWIKLHTRSDAEILVNLALASDMLRNDEENLTVICYPFHNPCLDEEETYHLKVKETLAEIMAML